MHHPELCNWYEVYINPFSTALARCITYKTLPTTHPDTSLAVLMGKKHTTEYIIVFVKKNIQNRLIRL